MHPEQVARKLAPYREAHRMERPIPRHIHHRKAGGGGAFPAAEPGAPRADLHAGGYQARPAAGETTVVWRHDGQPVPLRPFAWL